jgi:O-antigen ligase
MLIEVRLSPQLHTWVYGFFPHSFLQQIRGGGYRPVVFLGHGLLVAILTAMTIVATAYLAQRRAKIFGISAWAWLIYLVVVMILCRTLGALILSAVALFAMIVFQRRGIRLICGSIAIAVLLYPVLRGVDVVPVQAFADQIVAVDEERASSFQFRIDNEDQLLERADQRPLFGWGDYGRNRVYDEYTGRDLSETDGTWIIIIGSNGWAGYIAAFGILCLPMIAALRRDARLSPAGTALSLILAINLLDLLPNSSLTPLTWLMAGALAGMPRRSVRTTSYLTSHRKQRENAHLA